MSKIILIMLTLSVSSTSYASLEKGIRLLNQNKLKKGALLLEKNFETAAPYEQAQIALILSRLKDIELENSALYYAKYALKNLNKELSEKEKMQLHVELADYYLSLSNLQRTKDYYLEALRVAKNEESKNYLNYRLAWVEYNMGDYDKAFNKTILLIKTKNPTIVEDSYFLLGKIANNKPNYISKLTNQKILTHTSFIKGIKSLGISSQNERNTPMATRVFLAAHGLMSNQCDVINKIDDLEDTIEVSDKKLSSFFKKCLAQNPQHALKAISYTQDFKHFNEVRALAYYVTGQNNKACALYKKLYQNDKMKYFDALSSSCPIEKISFYEQVSTSRNCESPIQYQNLDQNVLGNLYHVQVIKNQALLRQALLQHPEYEKNDQLIKKLNACPQKKDIIAKIILSSQKTPNYQRDEYYEKRCEDNTQDMIAAAYMSYLYADNKLKKQNKKCFNQLSEQTKKRLLSIIDYNKVKKHKCFNNFDCENQRISAFIQDNQTLWFKTKKYRSFFKRLNSIEKAKRILDKGLSINNIESLYNEIRFTKRAFIKPAFYNKSLIKVSVQRYNSIIEQTLMTLEHTKGLNEQQKNMLRNALKNEKVLL